MKSSKNRLNELQELYFEGSTTLQQEQELRELLLSAGDSLSPEEQALMVMLRGFDELSREEPKSAAQWSPPKAKRISLSRHRAWISSAVAAVVIGVVALLNFNNREVYCYVNGEAVTDPQKAMEYMNYINIESSNTIEMLQHLKAIEQVETSLSIIESLTK